MITDYIDSATDNTVFAREYFWSLICKTETARRNQEGERHCSQQTRGSWLGSEKKECLLLTKHTWFTVSDCTGSLFQLGEQECKTGLKAV